MRISISSLTSTTHTHFVASEILEHTNSLVSLHLELLALHLQNNHSNTNTINSRLRARTQVLGCIIVAALERLVDLSVVPTLWRVKFDDFLIWLVTFIATLFGGVQYDRLLILDTNICIHTHTHTHTNVGTV